MANKTNCVINGKPYYKINRKIGRKINDNGIFVDAYKTFYGKNKKEAVSKYDDFMKKKENGTLSNDVHFGEAISEYITNVFLKDSKYSERTKERYILAFNGNMRDANISGMLLNDIRSIDLQKFYNELSCGASTVKNIHKLLRIFYKYLKYEGITNDITLNLVLPKVSSKKENEEVIEVWDEEELDTIISDSKGHRLHFLLLLASQTGLRIGELLSLTYDDIEDDMLKVTKQLIRKPLFKNGKMTESVLSVSNTKTKSSVRSIPLSSDTIKALEEHKKWQTEDMMKYGYRTEYLFTTKFGNYYDNSSLRVSCNRLYKKIGIQPRSFHVYRHTFGTNLAKNGVPIQVVSELMGHSDINVTAKYYINIDKDEKRNAINKLNC